MAMQTPNKIFNMQLLKQVKKNYSLIPIVVVGSFGLGLAAFAMARTLAKSPDITINKKSSSLPYEKYLKEDGTHVQYKV